MEKADAHWLTERIGNAPQWLAMGAYATLVYAYWKTGMSYHTFATILGYSLLFFSKYYKDKKNIRLSKQLQVFGYSSILVGLHFTHWRDAFAVLGYALAIADVPEANVVLAFVLAFAARESHSVPLVAARAALILYLL